MRDRVDEPGSATVVGEAFKDDNERTMKMSRKTKQVANTTKQAESRKSRPILDPALEAAIRSNPFIKMRRENTTVALPDPRPLYEKHEPLRKDLRKYVIRFTCDMATQSYGFFEHPLLTTRVHSIEHCAFIHHQLKTREQMVLDYEKKGDLQQAVMTHEKPYRFEALARYEPQMADDTFWRTFGDAWTSSDNLWQDAEMIEGWLSSSKPCREQMMSAEERQALKRMPDAITIYRGYSGRGTWRGWSWTIEKDKGEWFARRPRGPGEDSPSDPTLVEATVKKADVIAYIAARNESEIVVDPRKVKIVSTTVLKPSRKRPRLVRMTDWLKAQMEKRTSTSCPAPGDGTA